jgi:hypothetical protein
VDVLGLYGLVYAHELELTLTLILISLIGGGVSRALTSVTIAPFRPHNTIVSLTLSTPLDKTTSMVVPRPSMTLTSRIVQSSSEIYISLAFILSCVSLTSSNSISGTPSPVTADVGTSEMFFPRFLFSSKISAFKPCSANASLVLATLSSNSLMTDRFWFARVSLKPPFLVGFQSYILSIWKCQLCLEAQRLLTLLRATMNGVFRCLSKLRDSIV